MILGNRAGGAFTAALRYSLAVVVVVVAMTLRWGLVRGFGAFPLYITFYPAVLLVAMIAGGGPGVLATLLSALAVDYFFIEHVGSVFVTSTHDLIALAIFTGTNLLLCALSQRLRRLRWAAAIAQQKELLATTLASISDGVMVTDVRGCVTFVNDAGERLVGWKLAQAVGQPLPSVFKIIDDATRQPVENLAETVLRQGTLAGLADHAILMARDGREIPIDPIGTLVRSGAGEVEGVVVSFRDFTERKRARDQLQLHMTVLESAANAIVITGPDGVIQWVNSAFTRLTGYEAAQAIGQNPRVLKSGVQDAVFFKEMWQTITAGRVWHGELVNRRKDGALYDEEMTITPVRSAAGQITHFIAIKQDISERKRDEDVIKRTTEKLARSNQDLEQFASVASHDLQEPLRMVSGYLQLIERRYRDKLDSEAKEFIGFAVDGAMRMSRLITDLLDYSRINTRGKQPEPVNMEIVLKRAVENLQEAIRDSNATITHEELPTVQGDATQLVQLLQNLVGNAIKFRAADRPVRVYIGARKLDDEWVFSVKDEGIGIEPRYAEKIFLIFQRLHSRAEYPGTGIGLAICKKIVERHGGRIWVESQSGQGSTFFFTIGNTGTTR